MSEAEIDRKIYEVASKVAQDQGLELVEVKIGRHRQDVMIQILADKSQGGIILEECALLNRYIVESIDKEAFFSEDGYSLEVASPGLDRPLSTVKDFTRNLNAEVHFWLKEKVEGKVEYKGIVKSVSQENVILTTTTKDHKEIDIPLTKILKALLVIK
jgi:ribosome maturation factor RimP